MSLRDPEQLRAEIRRWERVIQTWKSRTGLTDEHPIIRARLNRIAIAQRLLAQADVTKNDQPKEA